MYKNKIGIFLIIIGISVISYGAFLDDSKMNGQKVNSAQITESSGTVAFRTIVQNATPSNDFASPGYVAEKVGVKKFAFEANLKIREKNFKLEFNKGEVLYDALKRLQTKGEVEMKGQEYSGLGFFIEEINNLKPDKGKSLILFINGKKADVGVSGYELRDKDLIEFKIEDNY
jgi:hypothetical protein